MANFFAPTKDETFKVVNSNLEGISYVVQKYSTYSFQVVYDAGLAADFIIMGSLDGINFSDLNYIIESASGAAGSSIVDVPKSAVPYVKFKINYISGSANVSVLFSAKGGS